MEDFIGTQQGIYDVLYECDCKTKDGHKLYHVKCVECGWETDIQKRHISRATKCKHKLIDGNYISERQWTNTRLHNIYNKIISRCYNPKDKDFRFYGGKGVGVYKEWCTNSDLFEQWALSSGYRDDLTIDRIDGSQDYCPNNCRWVSIQDNAKYKSTTFMLEVNGEKHTGRDWATICHLGTNTINMLLRQHSTNTVRKFIEARLTNPTKIRHSHQTWLDVYNIDD